MKRNPFAFAISLSAIAVLACATAITVTEVNAQQPGGSGDPLGKFVGSGTCTGQALGEDMKAFHATTGKFSSQKILDGNWVEIRYDEERSTAVTKPFHVVQYIGYDKARKRYVSVLVDNSGSGYSTGTSTGTSTGWKGDSITFDESLDGKPASFRDTFTTSSNGMSSHTGTMRDKHGKWIKTDEEHCTSA